MKMDIFNNKKLIKRIVWSQRPNNQLMNEFFRSLYLCRHCTDRWSLFLLKFLLQMVTFFFQLLKKYIYLPYCIKKNQWVKFCNMPGNHGKQQQIENSLVELQPESLSCFCCGVDIASGPVIDEWWSQPDSLKKKSSLEVAAKVKRWSWLDLCT